jgi:hypothetical protein
MTFDQYKAEVDRQLTLIAGVVSDDLMDWDYWAAYSTDCNARECALDVLEDNGYAV